MPLWCNSCRCHVSAPCASHPSLPEDRRRASCGRFRSTKGASKARRDHINHEIRNMRALLPVAPEDQERLSYLHSMAAICAYIRKSVLFRGLQTEDCRRCSLPGEAFLQALHGFVLVTTAQGKLVYVSENVDEYLGVSMIDVLQGDSVYDMVERSDVDVVKSNLDVGRSSSPERSFICCMQTSKAFKLQHGSCCSMLVRGSFQASSSSSSSSSVGPLFVALCTPTVNRSRSSDARFCLSFSSTHRLDMAFTHLSDSVVHFLGFSAEELTGRSWYSLVHPEDLLQSADSHRSLLQADEDFEVEMVLRLQGKDLAWAWVYTQAQKDSDSISCTNFIVSETEGGFLRRKISSDAFRPSSSPVTSCHFAAQQAPHAKCCSDGHCLKRRRSLNSQSEGPGAKARRPSEEDRYYLSCASSQGDSSPISLGDGAALFTPPYSPASSSSPSSSSPLQEELSRELLMDVHGYADQLLSSPESSPSYYSYPEAALACHQSPADSLPAAAEQTFDQAAFGLLPTPSPLPSPSPAYDFQACASDARLVPGGLSVSDMCASPVECALHRDDFSLLEPPQEGALIQFHHVPRHALPIHSSLLTPNQSPASAEPNQYNEREQAEISILAEQISSLASNFDMYHTLNPLQDAPTDALPSACEWPGHAPLLLARPLKAELVLDDGVFDSILKDLDVATGKSSAPGPGEASYGYEQLEREHVGLSTVGPGDPLAADPFAAMEPFSVQMGHPDHNTGLHQLNHFMQSSLQQDGLTEDDLY